METKAIASLSQQKTLFVFEGGNVIGAILVLGSKSNIKVTRGKNSLQCSSTIFRLVKLPFLKLQIIYYVKGKRYHLELIGKA